MSANDQKSGTKPEMWPERQVLAERASERIELSRGLSKLFSVTDEEMKYMPPWFSKLKEIVEEVQTEKSEEREPSIVPSS
jgi:hypothetical protein